MSIKFIYSNGEHRSHYYVEDRKIPNSNITDLIVELQLKGKFYNERSFFVVLDFVKIPKENSGN